MRRLLFLSLLLTILLPLPAAIAQQHDEPGTADTSSHTNGSAVIDEVQAQDMAAPDTAQPGKHAENAEGELTTEMHDADPHEVEAAGAHGLPLGSVLPLWSALPFIGILLSIALFPLFAPNFWHHNFGKISLFWALVFAVPFIIAYKAAAVDAVLHIYITDYIPFIILLWGLFTASGGILLRGSLVGTPGVNLLLLLIGTILASWMGTTGAAMVLIRPLIRANRHRKYRVHVIIFFIFLVANIGGSLTPLGDPPLFLGFLHGVPFFWTLNIFPHMAVMAVALLLIFFVLDTILHLREKKTLELDTTSEKTPLSLHGLHNLLFLLGIMGAVLFSGSVDLGHLEFSGMHVAWAAIARDLFIILMIVLSLVTTPYIRKDVADELNRSKMGREKLAQNIRRGNEFDWFPIKEVAILFAGIFMTIIPMLAMLRAGLEGHLAFIIEATREPAQFFWITGTLSSFLDNAPTYLTFFNLAQGRLGLTDALVNQMLTGEVQHAMTTQFIPILKAISAGAVFFGAMTYIGNAPNFMVRSIAEEQKIKMPSFFGYMLWSIGILVPLFFVITLVFFS